MKPAKYMLIDKFAIGFSALCAIHCIAFPLLLSLFPSLLSLGLEGEAFHQMMLWFVIPSSAVGITLGCRKHKDLIVCGMAAVGIIGLTIAGLYGHDLFGEVGEKVVTVIAALTIAGAHWRNFVLCQERDCKIQQPD